MVSSLVGVSTNCGRVHRDPGSGQRTMNRCRSANGAVHPSPAQAIGLGLAQNDIGGLKARSNGPPVCHSRSAGGKRNCPQMAAD